MTYKAYAGLCGFVCVCGKHGYTSRALARKAAKVKHPGEHLSAYQCGRYWHLGHLPQAAAHGTKGRREVYGR